MRCIAIALGAVLGLTAPLWSFEIEDQRFYPGTEDRTVRILSTADLSVFEPFVLSFQTANPELGIDYTVVSSTDLHAALRGGAVYDLALSSAMDLQFQLANDGLAQSYQSATTEALPDWARWRDLIFAFTAEPAVAVINTELFEGLSPPATRQDLITILRENPERFQGAVGTYDVRQSGLGYLFATQEARSSDAYWRLSEVMGRLEPRLYCCSAQMIDDVAAGRLALAYNVLGSYVEGRLAHEPDSAMRIIAMEDFETVMLRTALIPATATEIRGAGEVLDALLAAGMQDAPSQSILPPLAQSRADEGFSFGPIRLGPALMVYLDPLNRRAFLEAWENAMEQE